MGTVSSSLGRRGQDHFEPEAALDPQERRHLRGHLEQIDYTAFAANREILGKALGHADLAKFQRLAVAAAQSRALWVAASLKAAETGQPLSAEQVTRLATLRHAFEELTAVYEGMRRMVERGYLHYKAKP